MCVHCLQGNGASGILRDIARARENIQKSLAGVSTAWLPAACLLPQPACRRPQAPRSAHSCLLPARALLSPVMGWVASQVLC